MRLHNEYDTEYDTAQFRLQREFFATTSSIRCSIIFNKWGLNFFIPELTGSRVVLVGAVGTRVAKVLDANRMSNPDFAPF